MKKISTAIVIVLIVGTGLYLLPSNNGTKRPFNEEEESNRGFSYLDILHNDEFKETMQLAVRTNDRVLAKNMQQKALEVAEAAELPQVQRDLLAGERGLDYLWFIAKRQVFSEEVEKRFWNLQSIDDLKSQYPEAQDLFARSEQLIEQRDQQIQAIAVELAEGQPLEAYLKQAQSQWLAQHQNANPTDDSR